MSFDQIKYINVYNKKNYKLYQFRIKKDKVSLIKFLDTLENRNNFIFNLLLKESKKEILDIDFIKTKIKPILKSHNIDKIFLFGSYARGEANRNSDVDIFCNKGDISTLIEHTRLIEELEKVLKKKVDVVFDSSRIDNYFYENIKKDFIKL